MIGRTCDQILVTFICILSFNAFSETWYSLAKRTAPHYAHGHNGPERISPIELGCE